MHSEGNMVTSVGENAPSGVAGSAATNVGEHDDVASFGGGETFDVLVVGAGLAGLQTARLLGRAGRRVLLLDRKHSPDAAVHTTGIFVRRTLEDFELPADCLGPEVRHVTLYSPARRALHLESGHAEFRVGRMGRLYLRLLSECRRSGVVWSPGTRFVGCDTETSDRAAETNDVRTGAAAGAPRDARGPKIDPLSVRASARDGAAGGRARPQVIAPMRVRLERSGREFDVRARFVVGADGALSAVARSLALDVNREWIVGVEDVFAGAPSGGPPRFHCFLDPALAPGYLAWVVSDGEETHVGVGGYAARFDASRALEQFRASLDGVVDLSRARKVERRGGRIPVGGVLRRIACRRGLLVGDAAGAVSPLTAGGLDPCLRLSTLAARVADEYLSTGDPATLAAYSGARFRARFTLRLWMRRALGAVRTPLAAEAACALLRLPPFDRLARHVFFGRGSFPDVDDAIPDAARRAARGAAAL